MESSSPPTYSWRAPLLACFLASTALAQISLALGLEPGSAALANCFTAFQSADSQARNSCPTLPAEKKCSAVSPSKCPPPFNSRGRCCGGPELNNSKTPRTLVIAFCIFLRQGHSLVPKSLRRVPSCGSKLKLLARGCRIV